MKRRAAKLGVRAATYYAVGFPATVATTWLAAAMYPIDGQPNMVGVNTSKSSQRIQRQYCFGSDSGDVLVEIRGGPFNTEVALCPTGANPSGLVYSATIRKQYPLVNQSIVDTRLLPSWATLPDNLPQDNLITTGAWGWPLRALKGVERDRFVYTSGSPNPFVRPHLEDYVTPSWPTMGLDIRMLPTKPIPTGLALDAAVHGAALAIPQMSFAALALLRKQFRKRNGACLKCGYDITSVMICPECGTRC